ncbi:MAG: hypothetical protein LC790_10770, partial [Actinobacteria bacterium]|nr:hypothetical protein [Actinomycetota bacterium]
MRPAAALIFASSSSPDTAWASLRQLGLGVSQTSRRCFALGSALRRRARSAEPQQLREPGRGLQRGVQQHVVVGG